MQQGCEVGMELHLHDKNCHLCNSQKRDFWHEFRLSYKSITFVVHFCCHYYGKDWRDASDIVGELYDDIETCSYWKDTDLIPAMHYGLHHKGYWGHECQEYQTCKDCGCDYASEEFKRIDDWVFGTRHRLRLFNKDLDVSEFLGKRFCCECSKVREGKLIELNERERELWYERQQQWFEREQQKRRELSQLRKLQGLFSEAKTALRQNKGHEALQLLKEGFEQAASLRE